MSYEVEIAEKNDQRWRDYSADFTPPVVAWQALNALGVARSIITTALRSKRRIRVLCPCAGAGVYAMVLRAMIEHDLSDVADCCIGDVAHITAIEVRQEETVHLQRWADRVLIGDALEALEYHGERYDWIIDNPAFPMLQKLIPACASRLEDHGKIVFLMPTQSLQSKESHDMLLDLARVHATTAISEYRCCGRVRYRIGRNMKNRKEYTADLREYGHRVFVRDRQRAISQLQQYQDSKLLSSACFQLPPLPIDAREWKTRPGTQKTFTMWDLAC